MTLQITQIPDSTPVTYIGTSNTANFPAATNRTPILPITVKQTSDISSLFKVKFILRVYDGAVDPANLLCVLKQRPNNFSKTTNSVAIFDVRGIINSILSFTNADTGATSAASEVHKIGSNVNTKIFSTNTSTVQTIVFKASYEYAASATVAPIEQTGGGDIVQFTGYFLPSTFPLYTSITTNPFNDYVAVDSSALFLTNTPSITDYRHRNLAIGGASVLSGYINYVSKTTDFQTFGFLNFWSSDPEFMALKYYNSIGSQVGSTYTFENTSTQGGEDPASANQDSEYLLFGGVGPANLEGYNGACFKGGAATTNFDGEPSIVGDWAYYELYLCASDDGTNRRTTSYYFVKDGTTDNNCKGQNIVRLGWINSFGAWDYFNFKGGQVETIQTDRKNYKQILGSTSLESLSSYEYYKYEGGNQTLYTTAKKTATLETQFIEQEEAQFLENLFNSPTVMIIDKGDITTTQRVLITNKSMEKKTKDKNRIQIQYTFDIEYSNPINTIS